MIDFYDCYCYYRIHMLLPSQMEGWCFDAHMLLRGEHYGPTSVALDIPSRGFLHAASTLRPGGRKASGMVTFQPQKPIAQQFTAKT